MKQVAILHYAAPPIIGGVENTIYFQAKHLKERGFQVKVLTGRGADFLTDVKTILIPMLDSKDHRISQLNKKLFCGQVDQKFFLLKEEIKTLLSTHLTGSQYLIAHNVLTLHKNLPLTCALLELAEQKKTKIIAWCHDLAHKDPLYAPDLHPGYPWEVLAQAHPGIQYVTVSNHRQTLLAELTGLPKAEIEVIPPGVDPDLLFQLDPVLKELSERLQLFTAWPLLLYPARITRRKNIELAIAIMAALSRQFPTSKLLITGPPGPHNPTNMAYLEELNTLRDQYHLEDKVLFLYELGATAAPLLLGPELVAKLYQLADGLLFTSRREGFGMPILEAALFSLPIFASRLPSIQDTAAGFAHLFDPKSPPEKIASKIQEFYHQHAPSQFKHKVLKNFTWQAILDNKLIPLLR